LRPDLARVEEPLRIPGAFDGRHGRERGRVELEGEIVPPEEADAVLGRTIREVEANKLDESALMAFSLALDQAQLAISDRRATLCGVSPPAPGATLPVDPNQTAVERARTRIKQLRKSAKIVPEPS